MDINHMWGEDLQVSETGDLGTVDGTDMTLQRILRRLMTAPSAYIWHPEYGAGVPQMIGRPMNVEDIEAICRQQIMAEAPVAKDPIPQVTVTKITNGVNCHILFWSADTGQQQTLTFDYTQ
jgi:hypothetical protein